jgi:hypothetical protein
MATAPKAANNTGKFSAVEQGYEVPKEAIAINIKPQQNKVKWFNPESFKKAIKIRETKTQRKRKNRKSRKSRKSRKPRRN